LAELGPDSPLGRCRTVESLGYLDFLALEERAALVVTDSGGVQEETTYLGVPCLTIRPNTERPVTISHGTNTLVEAESTAIASAARVKLGSREGREHRKPLLWDGHAAERIADALLQESVTA